MMNSSLKTRISNRLFPPMPMAIWFCLFLSGMMFRGSEAMAQEENTTVSQSAVLVELFTSEGCSSCPPADDNLKRLAKLADDKGFPIYTLSYHVDYWDYLGWKDRFSSAEATKRQRRYSAAFQSKRIYTPQFVVNGQWEFVGSNRTHTLAAILKAMEQNIPAAINVSAKSVQSSIHIEYSASGIAEGNRLVIALAQNAATTDVARGENSGRTLKHIHVVRDFKELLANDSVDVAFDQPADFDEAKYHVLAYVQSARDLSLLGIEKAEIQSTEMSDASGSGS